MNTPTQLTRRQMIATAAGVCAAGSLAAKPRDAMRMLPPSQAVTVREEPEWYMHSAGVVEVGRELVCTYRVSDEHMASIVSIWCARSKDGGRTWGEHQLISETSWEKDKATWVAPQLTKLKDGRLMVLVDLGQKQFKQDWPMLVQWQKPDRGMSNHLFVSADGGRTWQGPRKADEVGGEPSYIVELSNGTLMYTRTDSKPTSVIKVPSLPWGPNYYRNTAVFSDDKGETWSRTSVLADDPFGGDCEVGVVELSPGRLLAISRIGESGGALGQPSRFIYSEDYGRTWGKPQISPLYAQRPIVRKLQSGKLLCTYRNAWGTPAIYAVRWDPSETLSYQPNAMIWDESRVRMQDGAMEIRTAEGRESAVEFGLYPLEDDDSSIEFEAELRVMEADERGCSISAGAVIAFLPNRVHLAARPEAGFAIDATQWHRYRIVARDKKLSVYADGVLKLETPTDKVFTRRVRFGNRPGTATPPSPNSLTGNINIDSQVKAKGTNARPQPLRGMQYANNASRTLWRSVSAKVNNRRDYALDWSWNARTGNYPDQFRRDRMMLLEKCGSFAGGDCGYGGWTETSRGEIVLVDYNVGTPPAPKPRLRAYRFREGDLA